MAHQQLFASFLLDRSEGLEIALRAENVTEATPVTGKVQRLPASPDFVEGLMHLRNEAIPLINLKKRLGLAAQEYHDDAKVAVVKLFHRRYGLLFDDIKEVFAASPADVIKMDGALQTEDRIISSLISLDQGSRTVELLDLVSLFPGQAAMEMEKMSETLMDTAARERRYCRHVVFAFGGQLYGVPVEYAQEITFFESIDQMYKGAVEEKDHPRPFTSSIEDLYKHSNIDGSLLLRGRRIPVLSARRLLNGAGSGKEEYFSEKTRVIVISTPHFAFGLIVEEVRAIEKIPEDDILPVGGWGSTSVSGIYQKGKGNDIMLLDMDQLIYDHADELKALTRLSSGVEIPKPKEKERSLGAHHLITENCYLIFSIGKTMAVQLKDVQEIIEWTGVLGLPGATGFHKGIINLRGLVVPVINLRAFYGYKVLETHPAEQKLIICRSETRTVALEVDQIVTIYKQEQYQSATSVKKDLAKRKDTLDRLIVFVQEDKDNEHVLVVNIHNLIRNHLDVQAG